MNEGMKEKRRFPRMAVSLPVVLRHRGRLIPATTLNISCGGMYIDVSHPDISESAPVEVIFDLEEKRDLSLLGKITRVESAAQTSGLGVQFTDVFSLSHKAVQNYLRTNLH